MSAATSTPSRWSRALGLVAVAAVAFGLGWCWAPAPEHAGSGHDHPRAGSQPAEATEDTVYTCSMHPQIRRDEPGSCPICGMDLVPASSLGGSAADPEDDPAVIRLDERARRLARIQTTVVGEGDPSSRRRLLGRLEVDETRLNAVTAWVGGRVERLLVATTGVQIRRGQKVALLYSPEVYAAQRDLRIAARQLQALEQADPGATAAARSALEAARRRLALLGVPDATIDEMAREDEPTTQIAIRTPFSGTVIERSVTEGQYVKTGDPLYRVVDLSRLWVQLEAHESELEGLRLGDPVELDVSARPDLELEGRVQFIDPLVDPKTRVARVRIEVSNEDGRLRPGMYVEASVETGLELDGPAPALVVPDSAVLFTGRRSIVYVEVPSERGHAYQARVVELGAMLDDAYVVTSGLAAGERVVVEGAFVLDADLQIRGGPSAMSRDLSAAPAWSKLVEAYVSVQTALAADDLGAAQPPARDVATSARDVDDPVAARLEAAATELADAEDIAAARKAFETVSAAMLDLVSRRGNPLSIPLRVTFCPMVDDDRGGSWLQTAEEVDNPFFGSMMRTCGQVQETLQPGETLEVEP